MSTAPRARLRSLMTRLDNGHVVKFLLVGGASFAIDLGLLVLLHEVFNVDLWIATPIAFLTSLVFNFLVQRSFTFKSTQKRTSSMLRYGLLVVFNTLMTDVIVNLFHDLSLTYAAGKVVATALTMIWNFFLYKHWVFRANAKPAAELPGSIEIAPKR